MTHAFEVGKTYYGRSVCDHDCIWYFKVLSRTAKMVTLQEVLNGHPSSVPLRRKVDVYCGVEQCKPHGSYSMALILGADRPVVEEVA